MSNTPNNTPSTFIEKMNQPSGVSILTVMAYSAAMGIIAIAATFFEPVASHPALKIPLYICAGLLVALIAICPFVGIDTSADTEETTDA